MPRRKYKYKKIKKNRLSYNEKLLYLISFILTIILSLLITIFSKNEFKFYNKNKNETNVPYTGSAVRKESAVRKDYEQFYREKQDKWKKEYQDILDNKEVIKKLEKLDIERKKSK